MTNRYITFETYAGSVGALTESEHKSQGLPDDVADWVWQYADNKEVAMSLHVEKCDRLDAILNAGLDMPHTIGD